MVVYKMIHMECQPLFPLKSKKKNLKMSSTAVVISFLRVNFDSNWLFRCKLKSRSTIFALITALCTDVFQN